jgi:hypothetical protein
MQRDRAAANSLPGSSGHAALNGNQPAAKSRSHLIWAACGVLVTVLLASGGLIAAKRLSGTAPGSSGSIHGGREVVPGLIVGSRPVIVRTGKFTSTQLCETNDTMRYENAEVSVPGGVGFELQDNCDIELINCTIHARIGIESAGAGLGVTIKGGTLDATHTAALFHEGATLKLFDAKLTAPRGVVSTIFTFEATGSSVVAEGTALMSENLTMHATNTVVRGTVAIQVNPSGELHMAGGEVTGSDAAFDLSGIVTVHADGTKLQGEKRTSSLSEVHVK